MMIFMMMIFNGSFFMCRISCSTAAIVVISLFFKTFLEVNCLALSGPSGLGTIARKATRQGLYSFGGHVKYR
jgi:hypothetical protein